MGGTDAIDWTSTGTATGDTLTGLSLVEGTTYYLSIRATDTAGNVSAVSTGDGITIDLTAPAGTDVNDGTGEDMAYSGLDSTLSANWDAFTEATSGISAYEVSIGTAEGATNILDWADNGTDTTFTKPRLSLSNGTTYYMNVRATDLAGNVSTTVTSDGVIVDTAAPVAGSIIDGTDTDIDWTNSTSTLAATWGGFSDGLSGIQNYEYAIGTGGGSSGDNYSLSFDGSGDYVSLYNESGEDNRPITGVQNQFSILANFSANSFPSGVHKGIYWHRANTKDVGFRFNDINNIQFNIHHFNYLEYPIDANEWYFVAGTYDGSIIKLYVNGNRIHKKLIAFVGGKHLPMQHWQHFNKFDG